MTPDWLPMEEWQEFIKMRKTIKKPLTEYAQKLAIKTLIALRQQGHSPEDVLNQSILNCWQGLFPVKPVPTAQKSFIDQQRESAAAEFYRIVGGQS